MLKSRQEETPAKGAGGRKKVISWYSSIFYYLPEWLGHEATSPALLQRMAALPYLPPASERGTLLAVRLPASPVLRFLPFLMKSTEVQNPRRTSPCAVIGHASRCSCMYFPGQFSLLRTRTSCIDMLSLGQG